MACRRAGRPAPTDLPHHHPAYRNKDATNGLPTATRNDLCLSVSSSPKVSPRGPLATVPALLLGLAPVPERAKVYVDAVPTAARTLLPCLRTYVRAEAPATPETASGFKEPHLPRVALRPAISPCCVSTRRTARPRARRPATTDLPHSTPIPLQKHRRNKRAAPHQTQ